MQLFILNSYGKHVQAISFSIFVLLKWFGKYDTCVRIY